MSQNTSQVIPSQKITILLLSSIIIGGIIFRLVFSDFELPLNSDNLQYFWYAVDHSLGETKNSFQVHNNGWPLFLSIFFSFFNSENYLDFMALQKIISISISSLTAIPIYFLGKKFFSEKLALVGSFIFIFEPRIVQNSTFGISDPLYIIGLTIAIVFLIYSRKNFEFLSFMILGFTIGVRSEGLLLIPAFFIIYFWQKKISKQSIMRIIVCIMILSLILGIISLHKNFENQDQGLFSRINVGVSEIYSSPETNIAGSPANLLFDGILNFFKFLGWTQFPVWMFFVPIGFIILLIAKNQKTGIIFTLLFFISLPTLYAFSFASDTRYLFPLYPIFTILSLFFLNKISQNKKKFVYLQVVIVIGLITSSSIFLMWKDVDEQKELEIFSLIKKIPDDVKIVNQFGYESSYVTPAKLEEIQTFPITSKQADQYGMTVVNVPRVNSVSEFMEYSFENGLTHWVIKEDNSKVFLNEIYKNEDDYRFLVKEFDSKDDGHNIPLKIFRVDYEKYD